MKHNYKITTPGKRDTYAETFRDAIRIATNRQKPGIKVVIYTWNKSKQQWEVQ